MNKLRMDKTNVVHMQIWCWGACSECVFNSRENENDEMEQRQGKGWDEKPTQSKYKYWPKWITCSFIYIVHVRCVFSYGIRYGYWCARQAIQQRRHRNRRIDTEKWNWTISFSNPKIFITNRNNAGPSICGITEIKLTVFFLSFSYKQNDVTHAEW